MHPIRGDECTSQGRAQQPLNKHGNDTGFRIAGVLQHYAHGTTHEHSKLHRYKKCKAYPHFCMKPQSISILSQAFTNCYGMWIKRQPRVSLMAGSQPAAMPWSASILKTKLRYNQGSAPPSNLGACLFSNTNTSKEKMPMHEDKSA